MRPWESHEVLIVTKANSRKNQSKDIFHSWEPSLIPSPACFSNDIRGALRPRFYQRWWWVCGFLLSTSYFRLAQAARRRSGNLRVPSPHGKIQCGRQYECRFGLLDQCYCEWADDLSRFGQKHCAIRFSDVRVSWHPRGND